MSARRAATRERLLAAAVGVFAERGVRGASVEEICEAAGFTRGAFYSNFADKDELVLALLRRESQAQLSAAEHAVDAVIGLVGEQRPEPETLVTVALAAFAAVAPTDRASTMTRQELLLHAVREPGLQGPYWAYVEQCRLQFAHLIEHAMAAVGLHFAVDFEVALRLLEAVHAQMLTDALFTGRIDSGAMRSLLLALSAEQTAR